MKELLDKINQYHQELMDGKLHAADLEPMLQTIRDLEEQVIVLRYKAFEPQVNATEQTNEESATTPEQNDNSSSFSFDFSGTEEEPLSEEVPTPIGDTPEIPKNQTSIIDAIAEMQEQVSINDKLADEQADNTLADKLRKMPIDDLKSAIGLNQRFWFINNLFNEDAKAYNACIDKLNSQDSLSDAMKIIEEDIKEQFNWEDVEDKSVKKFIDFVERRYMERV